MLTMLAGGGCERYERQPLDLAGHQAAFLARTLDSVEVREFAAQLAPQVEESPFDLDDGVSCAEAEALAMVFNAELRMARLRAGVTSANAEHAGNWSDPALGVDLTRIIQSTPEPWKVFTSLGLTLPISGRLALEQKLAGAEHAAELVRVMQAEWAMRMAVRRAWTEWTVLDAQRITTHDFMSRVDQVLNVVDTMEAAGEMPRTEARLFRIEKAANRADEAMLEARVSEAGLRLRHLMGLSPDSVLTFQARGVGPAALEDQSDVGAIDPSALAERSLALSVALAEYEVAENALEYEMRAQYPDLGIAPGYGREDDQDQMLLGLSVPIPIFNGNRQGIERARAQRELARANVETRLEAVISDLRAAEVRLEAARRLRSVLETDIVPMVDAQYADARQLAQLGEVNALVLLESLSRQQQAKVQLIEARRAEALARIDVQEIIGPAPEPRPEEINAQDVDHHRRSLP